ncbi:golgin subfamily A member 1-like isoform X2 [Gigantopelta aegis]|uniref:golgin subfamily A member 1-like isoform X2 n=1 Tax=Gigantopelta aegis TaxID=1735272 RepID=UPI001B8876B0|nr:golgin subfamily A member 1-like isoform X2 [Gigantopelta aegis]
MFAKLKEKIQKEGGNVSEEKSFLSLPQPGHASPVKANVSPVQSPHGKNGVPPVDGANSGADSPAGSVFGEETSFTEDCSSQEEMATLLLKRTEQCKKLEAKISEYAAVIKEKNKTIDKLELVVKKHGEVTAKKLEEQNEKFQRLTATMVEKFENELKKKQQELQQAQEKVKNAEIFQKTLFKREEENDEVQGFTTQELAKVKHLLLIAEEDLMKGKSDLDFKTKQCELFEKTIKDQESDLVDIKEKLKDLETESERLREETIQHSKVVDIMTREKALFEKRLEEVNSELTEKINYISKRNIEFADLENELKVLQRNADVYQNKTTLLISEKDDHIENLQDRVTLLEQRVHDQTLSGDERHKALEAERDNLEHRLSESRQQLSEIKVSWSSKITHLEEQLEDLRHRLQDAEKRVLENFELASQKDRQYEKEKNELESLLQQSKLDWVVKESQLRGKITSLESQIFDIESAREHERSEVSQQIAHFESREQEYIEKQLLFEKEVQGLEAGYSELQAEISHRAAELESHRKNLEAKTRSEVFLIEKVSDLERQLEELNEKFETVHKDSRLQQVELTESEKDKDSLLVRNAELSQQMETHRQQTVERQQELQDEIADKSQTIDKLRLSVSQFEEKVSEYKSQIQHFESAQTQSIEKNIAHDELEKTVRSLQDQIAEKNKMLKKQEQTLKDLRITLQRELKVQSLPNDESSELRESSNSPVTSRKSDSNRRSDQYKHNASEPWNNPHLTHKNQMGDQSYAQVSAAALESQDDAKLKRGMAGIRQELDKDVNFQYLKHVILKFCCSREAESLQLIKALSMLLHFSRDEQELIKQTLQWKMSWFGPKPRVGQGQTSKIIPPSY